MSVRSRHAVAAVLLVALGGCGARLGYRHAYRGEQRSGLYGGPWVQTALSMAAETDSVGHAPFWMMQADYQFAQGDDFATLGTGLAIAPGASDGYHNAVTFMLSWEMWRGAAFHASICDGYGNLGVVQLCARWSTKGYWGFDLGGGLNATRIAGELHAQCEHGCSGGGFGGGD